MAAKIRTAGTRGFSARQRLAVCHSSFCSNSTTADEAHDRGLVREDPSTAESGGAAFDLLVRALEIGNRAMQLGPALAEEVDPEGLSCGRADASPMIFSAATGLEDPSCETVCFCKPLKQPVFSDLRHIHQLVGRWHLYRTETQSCIFRYTDGHGSCMALKLGRYFGL